MKWTILIILIAYFVAMFIIGLIANRKSKTVTDYYVAGRGLGGVITALVYMSSLVSAGALVGWTGQASSYGVWFIFAGCAVTIATYICWRLLSGKVMRLSKKLDLLTVPDFLEARFESRTARLIAGLILLIFTVPLMVSQFKAAGLLLNMVTGIDYKAAVVLFGVIVFVYVAFGGYFAVVYTDAVQGGLMLFGIAALVITALIAVGGNLGEAYAAANPIGAVSWPTTGSALTSTAFIAVLMNNFFGALGAPNYIKGFYSIRNRRAFRQGFTITVSIVVVLEICIVLLGLYGRIIFPEIDTADNVVYYMIQSLLPPLLAGIALAGLSAAVMSTVDSLLIQCASTVENDILTKTFRLGLSERRRVSIARATVAIIGGICVFWGLNPPEYLAFLMYPAWGALGLSFAWVFFLGLYWRRFNKAGAITSMVTSSITFVVWNALGNPLGIYHIQMALLVSVPATLIATLLTPPPRAETLSPFFAPSKVP